MDPVQYWLNKDGPPRPVLSDQKWNPVQYWQTKSGPTPGLVDKSGPGVSHAVPMVVSCLEAAVSYVGWYILMGILQMCFDYIILDYLAKNLLHVRSPHDTSHHIWSNESR